MIRFVSVTLRAAALAACLGLVLPARADTPSADAAQGLFDEAKALLGAGRASEACPKFEESQRLDPALGTSLNLADCYEKEGRLGVAWLTFRDAAAQARSGGHLDAAEVAEERGRDLAARLPKLVIDVRGAERTPGLSLQRNGSAVRREDFGQPVPAEPGTHHVLASAPGRESWVGSVVIGEAPNTTYIEVPELASLVRTHTPVPVEQSRPKRWDARRTAALAVGGVGLAGVVVGSVYGFTSIARGNDADEFCDGPRCRNPKGVRLRSDAQDAGTIATVAFAVGVLGAAGGTFLWLSAPASDAGTSVGVAPGGVSVRTLF